MHSNQNIFRFWGLFNVHMTVINRVCVYVNVKVCVCVYVYVKVCVCVCV